MVPSEPISEKGVIDLLVIKFINKIIQTKKN